MYLKNYTFFFTRNEIIAFSSKQYCSPHVSGNALWVTCNHQRYRKTERRFLNERICWSNIMDTPQFSGWCFIPGKQFLTSPVLMLQTFSPVSPDRATYNHYSYSQAAHSSHWPWDNSQRLATQGKGNPTWKILLFLPSQVIQN